MKNEHIQQKLRFKGYQIYSLTFNVKDNHTPLVSDDLSLEIAVNSNLQSEEKNGFYLYLQIQLHSENSDFELVLNSRSTFDTDTEIDAEYLKTPMVRVNAPAIVFPFLRAYITTITTNAGYPPLILPAINFAKLASSDQNSENTQVD